MNDISVFNLKVRIVASATFPSGIDATQFADDSDPFDVPELQIGEVAMGANGDLVGWSKANPLVINIGLVPNSDDDKNLGVLFEANRAGKGKQSAQDVISITAIYPDGRTASFTQGKIIKGAPANSAQSSGRMKSKMYSFAFENMNRT